MLLRFCDYNVGSGLWIRATNVWRAAGYLERRGIIGFVTQRSVPARLFLRCDLRRFLIPVEMGSQQGSEVHDRRK